MGKKVNVLASLLKCALFDEAVDEQVKIIVSQKPLELYKLTSSHDITHLVEYAFRKSGIVIADEALAEEYVKQQVMSVMRYENLSLALKNLSELFEKEKIPFVPLKGAVIRKFYPEPWMRTSCDIDVLVHEADLERAKDAIVEKLGFTFKGERGYHDVSLYADDDIHVELHFSVKENMRNVDKLLDRVWDYAWPKEEESYEYLLTDEFLVFQHVAHMAYHFVNGGCGIRSYIDLYLLKQKLRLNEDELSEMLDTCGIKKFYQLSLKLLNVWFCDEEHDETTRLMHKYIIEGGTYGSQDKAVISRTMKKGKTTYAFERIFMPYEQLTILYPFLKGKPYLVPFYQIKRWFGAAKKGKVGKAANELSKSINVENKSMEDLAEFFRRTGLK